MLSYLTDMEGVLKEYAAADAIAEEIINDKHQVMHAPTYMNVYLPYTCR